MAKIFFGFQSWNILIPLFISNEKLLTSFTQFESKPNYIDSIIFGAISVKMFSIKLY